ncbi:rhodanese-like domain-containing protein [Cryobacterium fucosi]|nr:rhodanese-like domain-containing protein [Cryobacterium fucosi]
MELTPQQVFTRLGEAQIVDVRETEELIDGTIPGARHIPLGMIPESYAALDTRPVVVVCRSGRRSAAAAEHLVEAGFDAHTMTGGMVEWAAEGLPLVLPQLP